MAEYRIQFTADSGAAQRSIRGLRQAIASVTQEFEKAEIGAEEFIASASDLRRLKKELKEARDEARQIAPRQDAFHPFSLAAYESKLKTLKNEARAIAPETTKWRELTKEIVKAENAIENINKRQRRGPSAEARLGAAGGAFLYGGGLGGGIGSALGGVAGGLLGGVPGAFTGAALGQATDNLISYAGAMARTVAEVNKARIALAGVVRDANDYDFAIQAAAQASNAFLLPIDQATRQFAKLQASVAGAGFTTKDTQRAFNGIAAAIIATGGTAEDLNGALTATAQVFSKGKVSAEELRQQIGERLPGAFTIFAESVNKTPQELDKALEQGQVSLSDFMKFVDELARRYGETAKILGDAPENAGARLQVALTAASVAYGGFFQKVGAGFQDYATSLLEFAMENERQFKTVIATVRVAAEDLYTILSSAVDALFPVFQNFFQYIFDNFARGLNAIAKLADESRRAAGGPEKRAAAMVDQLYAGKPLEGHFGGRRQAYEEALRVEREYDKKQENLAKGRQSRIDKYVTDWMTPARPSKFGMGLGNATNSANYQSGIGTKKDAKLDKYNRSQLDFIEQAFEKNKQLLDQRRQELLISETSYKIKLAELTLEKEKKIFQEKFRLNSEKINADNLSAADKALALEDEKVRLANSLIIAENKRNIAVSGAKLELEKPFKDALRSENREIDKQTQLLDNLRQGFRELSPEQEAAFLIEEKLAGLDADEQRLIKNRIDGLKEQITLRLQNVKLLEKERAIFDLRNQAAQFRAPIGKERLVELMQTFGYTPEEAQAQFSLEEQNRKLQTMKEAATGLAGEINSSIGDALTNIATDFENLQQHGLNFIQTMANAFKSLANTIIQEMTRAMINKAVSSLFNFVMPAIGSFAGGAQIGQQVNMPTGVGIGAGNGILQNAGGQGFGTLGPNFGIRQFATGGMVTGPTLGLIGEGRFNEAVVPMPNGKSIPVDLGGAAGSNISTNIVVNMNNGQASSQMTGNGGQALGRELEGAVRSVLLKESRPGGIIYSQR